MFIGRIRMMFLGPIRIFLEAWILIRIFLAGRIPIRSNSIRIHDPGPGSKSAGFFSATRDNRYK